MSFFEDSEGCPDILNYTLKVEIKIVQEQWLHLKMNFQWCLTWKLLFSVGLTFGRKGKNFVGEVYWREGFQVGRMSKFSATREVSPNHTSWKNPSFAALKQCHELKVHFKCSDSQEYISACSEFFSGNLFS